MNYWLEKQIKSQRDEHEAFHALMKLIPYGSINEAIKLWAKGKNASINEDRAITIQKESLTEEEFKANQNLAHEAWVEMMDLPKAKVNN